MREASGSGRNDFLVESQRRLLAQMERFHGTYLGWFVTAILAMIIEGLLVVVRVMGLGVASVATQLPFLLDFGGYFIAAALFKGYYEFISRAGGLLREVKAANGRAEFSTGITAYLGLVGTFLLSVAVPVGPEEKPLDEEMHDLKVGLNLARVGALLGYAALLLTILSLLLGSLALPMAEVFLVPFTVGFVVSAVILAIHFGLALRWIAIGRGWVTAFRRQEEWALALETQVADGGT